MSLHFNLRILTKESTKLEEGCIPTVQYFDFFCEQSFMKGIHFLFAISFAVVAFLLELAVGAFCLRSLKNDNLLGQYKADL